MRRGETGERKKLLFPEKEVFSSPLTPLFFQEKRGVLRRNGRSALWMFVSISTERSEMV